MRVSSRPYLIIPLTLLFSLSIKSLLSIFLVVWVHYLFLKIEVTFIIALVVNKKLIIMFFMLIIGGYVILGVGKLNLWVSAWVVEVMWDQLIVFYVPFVSFYTVLENHLFFSFLISNFIKARNNVQLIRTVDVVLFLL